MCYLIFGLVLSVLSLATTASAQNTVPAACADRGQALNHLSVKYAEAPVAMGLASNGGVVEVLSSTAGESWSILITMPNGMTCLIASGENWEKLKPQQAQGPLL
jgi:hypothetical protein